MLGVYTQLIEVSHLLLSRNDCLLYINQGPKWFSDLPKVIQKVSCCLVLPNSPLAEPKRFKTVHTLLELQGGIH